MHYLCEYIIIFPNNTQLRFIKQLQLRKLFFRYWRWTTDTKGVASLPSRVTGLMQKYDVQLVIYCGRSRCSEFPSVLCHSWSTWLSVTEGRWPIKKPALVIPKVLFRGNQPHTE